MPQRLQLRSRVFLSRSTAQICKCSSHLFKPSYDPRRALIVFAIFLSLASFCFASPQGPFRTQISPANGTVTLGGTQQLTARGAFLSVMGTGGKNLTSIATWRSSNPAIASVDATGVVSPHLRGTVVIQADSGPFHGSTQITVVPDLAVTSLAVSPATPSVAQGFTSQFIATATYSDASTQDVTAAATWSSTSPSVATIDSSGLARTHAQGATTISASFGGQSDSTSLTVTAPVITAIRVAPVAPSVANGLTSQFTATAIYSDASSQDVTATATWSSSNPAVATIDSSGLSTTHAQGTTSISAAFGGQSDSTTMTVTAPVVTSIRVTPATTTIAFFATVPFKATATLSDGTTADITATATWSSSNPAAVSVNSSGIATGLQVGGSATISATQGGVSGSGAVSAVTFSNANLNGQYAFLFRGSDAFDGLLVGAGSFQADGHGHVSNGVVDVNFVFDVAASQSFVATYAVGPDGRGTVAIANLLGNSTQFNFVLTANGDGVITQFDTEAVASGVLKKQDPAAFSPGALTGPFAFSQNGFVALSDNLFPAAAAGRFIADGAGNITSGEEDEDVGGHGGLIGIHGSYSVPASGRGQVTLRDTLGRTTNFAWYVISRKDVFLVSLDALTAVVGTATAQSDGLGTATLQGNYILSQDGIVSNDGFQNNFTPVASVGIMHADGLGAISNGKIDINRGGVFTDNLAFTGFYSADSAGRVQALFIPSNTNYVFYLISPSRAYFLTNDLQEVLSGVAEQQAPASFSTATLRGNFDFMFGDGLFGTTAISGQFAANGSGALSGNEDDNEIGTLTPNAALSGTYSIDSTGRGTTDMTSHNGTATLRFYVVSDSLVRFVEKVPSKTLFGLAQKQF
jgi:hypothetical protein